MKYILYTWISMTFAILFTASSGICNAEAYSDYNEYRNYQQDDLYKNGEKSLYRFDKEFLEGIDEEVLLNTAINLLNGLNIDTLNEKLLYS